MAWLLMLLSSLPMRVEAITAGICGAAAGSTAEEVMLALVFWLLLPQSEPPNWGDTTGSKCDEGSPDEAEGFASMDTT